MTPPFSKWDLQWVSALGASLSLSVQVASVFLPLSTLPRFILQPFGSEEKRVKTPVLRGSMPFESFELLSYLPLLSDAEMQLKQLAMTSSARTHPRWIECS